MLEARLTNFHKLVVTVFKSTFPKSRPKIITCRNFSNDLFRDSLNSLLSKENMTLEFTSIPCFTKIFIFTLNKPEPLTKK